MKSKDSIALVAYVPSPHRGYLQLFEKYRGATLYILGSDLIAGFQSLVRHLPGNDPADVRAMIRALRIFRDVRILTKDTLYEVRAFEVVMMPDEDVSRTVAEKYINRPVVFDASWRLRWDWGASQQNRRPEDERRVSFDEFDRECMRSAFQMAERSPDWWRQIGALLVKDGKVLISTYNQHMPHEQSAYLECDPRSNFDPGQRIEISVALHAEMAVMCTAARFGIATKSCDLYVSTFPCPPCAYACANMGIKRLFYVEGYALINGAETLESRNVEIVRVEM